MKKVDSTNLDKKEKRVVVVGGGLAGLACTMKLAEQGIHVDLISVTKVKRSHSVCAQGGINAAMNLKGENDSPDIHAYDTIKGGDFLTDQPGVLEMCHAGPKIIRMMEKLGVPFNRTPEGKIDFRRFGGTLYNRTAFCGASTGQQLLYALDEQVRRYEVQGLVKKYEHHEFLRLVQDENGQACGIVLHDLINLKLHFLPADSVVFGVGGPGLIYRLSTNSTFCSGAANGRLYMQGMRYANGEFIQIHPTSIPGSDKLRLISESVRGEGGRVWVYGDSTKKIEDPNGKMIQCGETGKPWYFLEEMYKIGNLVPRDIGAREILKVVEAGLGVDGKNMVYLDVSKFCNPPEPESSYEDKGFGPEKGREQWHKLESVLDIYQKFTGEDPREVPMKIFPGVHYSMGGAWVDFPAADDTDRNSRFRQMTNINGCFQIGESSFSIHGANRLGANSLLSCIYEGLVAGVEVPNFIDQLNNRYEYEENFEPKELKIEQEFQDDLFNRNGDENVYALHEELSHLMVMHMTVKRDNENLTKTYEKIKAIRERYNNIVLDDKGKTMNQTYVFANQFKYMLELALVMTKGALLRDESRGSHMKPEFKHRDDKNWLKHTIATYNPKTREPDITYIDVDNRHLDPIPRDYSKVKRVQVTLKNKPTTMEIPI